MWNSSDLKVDVIALPQRTGKDFIVVYNINIPVATVHDEELRRQALERAQRLLSADLAPSRMYYQLTGSYILRNTHTGDTKLFTGSFCPQGNCPSIIQGFQPFNAETFVQNSFAALDNAEEKLRSWRGLDTNFVFDRLVSVIVNVNAPVTQKHPILEKRQLLRSHGRYSRRHRTFKLP
jgi:hypothetical protein